jgi:hypothetical protein
MIKRLTVTAAAAVFGLLAFWGCGDDSVLPSGGGGDGDDDGIEGQYKLAPFTFHRHSVSIIGGRYGASVGMFGQAFLWQDWGMAFVPTGTGVPLNDVWHTGSADTMFMVGGYPFDDGAFIIRFLNGERTSMPHPIRGVVTAVDGPAWDRLYAVGTNGRIAEYRGGDFWTTFWVDEALEFTDVWVANPNNFWVAGENGAVYHYDGVDLRDKSIGVTGKVWSITGVSPDTVYAVAGGQIYEIKSTGSPQPVFTDPSGRNLLSIHASRPGWAVATGQTGRVVTFDGSDWDSGQLFTADDLTAVWTGTLGAEIWGTEGAHYMYVMGWRVLCVSDVEDWDGVHVYERDKAYGLLDGELWKYENGVWNLSTFIEDIHLGGLFAVGDTKIWAYNIPVPPDIDCFAYYFSDAPRRSFHLSSMDVPNDIWCADEDSVIMVGPYGSTWRYDPGISNFVPGSAGTSTKDLNAVWGASWSDIYAVGNEGTIVHSGDGAETWTEMASNTAVNLNDVWGWDDNHLVAVGDNGTVMVYSPPASPGQWAPISVPTGVSENLHHVWAGDSDNIWVSDGGDLIMRFDGSAWTRYGGLPNVRVKGISGNATTQPIFVCDEDFVFQYVPSAD